MVFPVSPGSLPAEVLRGGGEVGEVVAVFGEGGKLPFGVFEKIANVRIPSSLCSSLCCPFESD